ncbi:acyl-CoA thioester hydrolase/BAAT C-terminal domain-containing protein [Virgisporangium ochraceum]|uniref:Palmitoyl-CoA hydrolase n=1 Tax=Virgisporangium ochraceum TaxID=65505 RepID=A0A8J4EDP5_9ACTN|nr:acyl-CoA thioesterase/bile acid-CoA:amino acid N-acyltransferase family protein [Virgisporangium ochraceum]GIJ70798.1 palmitoyl-CoA hydrolase [Virgisporangium ochraceum]
MRIDVSPARPNLDTELHVRVVDAPPGAPVTLRATQRDLRGCRWQSTNVFTAGADGTVDLTRDGPVDGSYDGVDAMGPIWSMRPLDEPTFDGPVDVRQPAELDLDASAEGAEPATASVRRRRIPDGLVRTEVRDGGPVGVMYHPAGGSRLTAVIMLAGAEAGIHEDDAALLAAHGFAVLALALAGVPGRPPTLQDIPVEYAGLAIDHLRALPFVHPDRLAVIGGSKGGEAALLIGATYPAVTGVVSVVGSGVMIAGITQDVMTGSFLDILRTPVANWTLNGEPLPYVPTVVTPELEKLVADGAPVQLRLAFEPGLTPDVVARATIPVERINGPVLLLAGELDGSGGPVFHQIAADRLAAHGHPHEHVVYPGAGHLIAGPPYAPTTLTVVRVAGVACDYGGDPVSNARARADAWRRTREFLAAL